MSDNPSSPLLGARGSSSRPPSQRSKDSTISNRSKKAVQTSESTPLISREDEERNYGDAPQHAENSSTTKTWWRRYLHYPNSAKIRRRWPTILALSILTAIILVILGLGFAAPAAVEEYAREAMVFEPTNLSIHSFTSDGVVAHIQADFRLDASRVRKKSVRDLGRAGTWIAKEVESKESHVEAYLPEYGNILIGTATIPPIKVSVRNGVTTHIDELVDLTVGDVAGLKTVAQDWIGGSVKSLSMRGDAEIPLKSGIFSLGTLHFSEMFRLAGDDIPSLPPYNIERLNFQEVEFDGGTMGMGGDVIVTVVNNYSITFTIPPLGYQILVEDCSSDLPLIPLADAVTRSIDIKPKQDVTARILGLIKQLPDTVTRACPQTEKSPLDALVGDYMNGQDSTVYIKGSDPPSDETPDWLVDFMKSITIPVSFPGKTFGNLIRNFSLEDVHFGLPDPFASPKSPESHPRISAVVKALIGLPKEMNFTLSIPHVRATCDIFYHEKKLGVLDLSRWQDAKSERIQPNGDVQAGLALEAIVENAPLEITDENVFSDLVASLIFGNKKVVLAVEARVDAETETALGKFVVRDIPASGKVFVNRTVLRETFHAHSLLFHTAITNPSERNHTTLGSFLPHVTDLRITDTTPHTLLLQATLNFTNPTPYSATIPYFDILLTSNSTEIGHGTIRNVTLKRGNNTGVVVSALWNPQPLSDTSPAGTAHDADAAGRELISRYVSGIATNLTLQTYAGTLPNYPGIGRALSKFRFELPMPSLHSSPPSDSPGSCGGSNNDNDNEDDDDHECDEPHFIRGSIFHIFSSRATFDLFNPLPHNTLHMSYLNATAYYNHTDAIGQILETPGEGDGDAAGFDIPPGLSTSPALRVQWDLFSVGFGAIKAAIGGHLKLDALAEVEVEVDRWRSGRLWFKGHGIGARIRF